jgi:hypothetical protein
MPTLDRLQAKLGTDCFEVVALSIDRAGVGVVRKFYDDIGVKHHKLVIDQSGRRRWACLGSRRQSLSAPMAWNGRKRAGSTSANLRSAAFWSPVNPVAERKAYGEGSKRRETPK